MSDMAGGGDPTIVAFLEDIHRRMVDNRGGEVATYIPELAKVDPDAVGLAVATVDGHVYEVGDSDRPFTIQSVSKPFVYGLALDDHGADAVCRRIGVEPSGDAFNSIVMDERNNRPPNPMVNAGAIAATAMIRGRGREERWRRILEMFGRYAGRPLDVDRDVFESERATGHRNRAIAYLELSSGMITEPIDEHLDLYFQQCSVIVTARDLAVMAATLANGGINPVTGDRAIGPGNVKRVLSVMATCGMYDWSGEWMYRVGMPAKSGVGGGIIATLPGQLGLGSFAPRLDEFGNSTRGVQACQDLATSFALHQFDTQTLAGAVVRRTYTADAVPSKRRRSATERAVLERFGSQIGVYELQGDLVFAGAERLLRRLDDEVTGRQYVILGMQRVTTVHPSALTLLRRMERRLATSGIRVRLAGCSDELAGRFRSASGGSWPRRMFLPDVDAAVEWCEDLVLATHRPDDEQDALLEPDRLDVLSELDAEGLAAVRPSLQVLRFAPGEAIVREGEPADALLFLAAGGATVQLASGRSGGSPRRRLRSYGPGVVFGEPALFEGGLRSADVVADAETVCYRLPVAALHELARTDPAVHAQILLAVGRNLADLLRKATDELRTLD
jgi:glutaminase